MTDISGRTAFITGGANGIGLGIARALAGKGVKLALVDIDAGALDRAKAELSKLTQVATAVLDMRDRAQFTVVADTLEAAVGPVSLLVNNAGVAAGAAATKLTYDLWDWGLGINLGGVVNGVQTFLPRMVARKAGGHIVNTASGAGLVAAGAGVLYTTSKFAVVGMSEALEQELKPIGIGVTVLCPGPVATDIVARTFEMQDEVGNSTKVGQNEAAKAQIAAKTQWLQTGVKPDDVGQMVLSAIQENRLYVHTDRTVAEGLEARCKALLDALPAA